MDDKLTVRMEAIISSMTPKERAHPDLIKGSRKGRIAAGSGMQVQDVNKLLKQFTEMQRMMKKMSGKGGMRKMMGQMKNMLPRIRWWRSRSVLIFLFSCSSGQFKAHPG